MINLIKRHFKEYMRQEHLKDLFLLNILFMLFFMLSDSIDIFIPLYLAKLMNNFGWHYGLFQSITYIVRISFLLYLARRGIAFPKRLIIRVLFAGIFLNVFFGYGGTVNLFYISFGMMVIMRSVINGILNPLLAQMANKEQLGVVFGFRDIFISLGGALGLILSGQIIAHFSLMFYLGYLILGLTLMVICLLHCNDFSVMEKEAENVQWGYNLTDKSKRKNYLITIGINIGLILGMTCLSYLPMLALYRGLEEKTVYYGYSLAGCLTAIFSLLGGIIIDSYEKRNLYLGYIIICFTCVGALLLPGRNSIILCLFILGLKAVFDNTEQAYFFDYFYGENTTRLWSFSASCQMIVEIIAPLFVGKLFDLNITVMLIVSLGFIVFSFIGGLWLKKARGDKGGISI